MSRAVLNARAFSACCWTLWPVTQRARIVARSDMKRRSRFTSFQSTYSTRSVTSRLIFFLALRALSLFLVRTGLAIRRAPQRGRSEEHTSELQSLMRISYAVFCLKKKIYTKHDKTSVTTYIYIIHIPTLI